MNNQVFGVTFTSVFLSGLLFFGVANAGAAAVNKWLFPTEQFGDHTYIGTTDVSNMEVAGAMAQFSGTAETWRQSSELLVTYQDAMAKYPLDNAEILLEETAQQAQSGVQNSFVYDLQDKTTERFLAENFPEVEFSAGEVQKLTMTLEQALQSGLAQTHATISDDSLAVDRETVSEVVFPRKSSSEGATAVVAAIDGIQIAPGEKFSFLDVIDELKPVAMTDAELTEIASAIYSVVLKTNFKIEERSIGTQVPEEIPVGQEAAVNRSLDIDLVFSNPNASSFTLNTALKDDSVFASLSGFPFVYDYAVLTGIKETVNPRLIKQYSAFVTSGYAVEEEGSEGVRIEMIRSVLSEGEEVKAETISRDFYPPTNRVEIYPLTAPPAENVPEAGSDESSEGTEEGQTPEEGEAATDSTDGNTDAGSGKTDGQNSSGGNTPTNSTDQDTNTGSGIGNNAADKETDGSTSNLGKGSESDKPVYDKGGNLVNP